MAMKDVKSAVTIDVGEILLQGDREKPIAIIDQLNSIVIAIDTNSLLLAHERKKQTPGRVEKFVKGSGIAIPKITVDN